MLVTRRGTLSGLVSLFSLIMHAGCKVPVITDGAICSQIASLFLLKSILFKLTICLSSDHVVLCIYVYGVPFLLQQLFTAIL